LKSTPFIHLFSTSEGKYLYDVNTDAILKIPEEVYDYLYNKDLNNDVKKGSYYAAQYIEELKNQGYLNTNRVKVTEHPGTELLKYYINNKTSMITLQITQNCNLRCDYCIYSGKYHNREHSLKKMSRETARKSIDYYISHSRDTRNLAIGFYGGEPLLCMDMIRYCVEYANKNAEGKKNKIFYYYKWDTIYQRINTIFL